MHIIRAHAVAVIGSLTYAAAGDTLSRRLLNDPVSNYLSRMCYPIFTNVSANTNVPFLTELIPALANAETPCDRALYMSRACVANGTAPVDFLAEQQCLCNGAYWDVSAGCDACYFAHGFQERGPVEVASSRSSLSAAECTPSPPYQPYSNLFSQFTYDESSVSAAPGLTLGVDRFPNDTAASNYFTPTRSLTLGEITGSATGRLTSFTNISGVRYTPASLPTSSPTGTGAAVTGTSVTTPASGGGGSGSSATPATAATSPSTGAAAATDARSKAALLVALALTVALA